MNKDKKIIFRVFIIYYIISIGNAILFNFISNFFKIDSKFNNESQSILEIFITVVFFAPLIETFLFNYISQKIIEYFTFYKTAVVLISSLIFSLTHCYSFIYMIYAFFAGIVLNLFYYHCKYNFNLTIAFWITFLLHLAHNLTGFIILELI